MKRIAVLLFALLLFACQPTPAQEIVVNKAEGSLEQRISGTAVPDYRETYESVETETPNEPTLRTSLNVPERVQEKFDGNAVGAHLYLEIDAITDVPNVTRVPVLRGHIIDEIPTETERLCKLLLGDGPYLCPGRDRIAKTRKEMENTQAWLDALERQPYGPYADYDALRAWLEEKLQMAVRELADPQEGDRRAPEPWTGSFADVGYGIALGNETHSFSLTEDLFQYAIAAPYLMSHDTNRNRGPKSAEEQALLDGAAAFGSSLGFTETIPRTINCYDESQRMRFHSETGFDNGCYTFTLLPVYAGIPLYPYTTNYGSDTGLQAAGVHYDADKRQEQIFGSLENGMVVSLQWNFPFRVTDTENENIALLPFDEIMNTFRRQVFMNQYLDNGCDETIHITDIRFSYMRVKIRDSADYYLLPVWDFLGYEVDSEWDQRASAGELELARSWWNDQSLLTINAIDGSVINRNAGY